jgi:hypothetical protein
VLSCGCIGLVLAIVTLVMAKADLAQMDAGTMDPAGRANTSTGRVLAWVSVGIFIVAVVIALVGLATGAFNTSAE